MAVTVSENRVETPILSTAEATCQKPDDEIRIDVVEGGLDAAFKSQLQDPIILTDESVSRHTSDEIASDVKMGNSAPESRCLDPFALAGDLANEYLNALTLLGLDKEEVGALDVDPPDTVVARDLILGGGKEEYPFPILGFDFYCVSVTQSCTRCSMRYLSGTGMGSE